MSFNFTGTPVTSGTTGFTFGTPAGDAKASKTGFSLFGTTASTQSSDGFSFSSPAASVPLVQPAPLFGTTTFSSPIQSTTSTLGTGNSIFGTTRAIPSAFGITTTTASAPVVLGVPTIQPVRPSFTSNDESNFKISSTSGLLSSTFQPFGSPNSALQSTSFGASQSAFPTFGSTTQAATGIGASAQTATGIGASAQTGVPTFNVPAQPITATTFRSSQSTSVAAPQFSFGSSILAKPRIGVEAPVVSTSNFVPAISVPSFTTSKAPGTAVHPNLSFMNLGSTAPVMTPAFPLGSAKVTLPSLPTQATTTTSVLRSFTTTTTADTNTTITATNTASTAITTVSAVDAFGSGGASTVITIPHSTPTIVDGGALITSSAKSDFGASAPSITTPALNFGVTSIINTGKSALESSSNAPGASSTVMTTCANVMPSMKASTIAEVSTTETNNAIADVSSTLLTYGQLEDFINKWTLELENQSKIFANQAKQLNAWDRLLISNGDKILALNNSIERVKDHQHQLDQELDFIRAQQKELEHLIVPLEKELQETPVTDTDRNHTYQLAENMDSQLKQMSEDLKEIIETLNESNKNQELMNPITQIGRILNAHMNSLQWIDINTNKISSQLDQISKMHDINRRNHEIVLQRTYE